MKIAWIATAALIVFVRSACADWEFGGHAKGQFSCQLIAPDEIGAVSLGENARLATGDARLNTAWHQGSWEVTGQGQLFVLQGNLLRAREDPRLGKLGSSAFPLPEPSDSRQVLDLSRTLSEGDFHLIFGRLDRLTAGYTRGPLALRMGRQALSWGNGLVFQVFDLFNPFPPNAVDKEYKPGSDMATVQWLFSNGDDVQGIVVPRRAHRSRPLTATESSAAVKWRHLQGSFQIELLGARHYQNTIAGLGLTGNAAGGVWRLDLTESFAGDGSTVMSLVSNFDRTWTWAERNVYGFAEYFRNGFGETGFDRGLEGLDTRLLDRLGRGELFSLGRDELAGGLRIEWTPLTSLESTVLVNPRDPSAYFLPHLHHDWRQNLVVDAGAQLGLGGRGTEYGGVRSSQVDRYFAPGRTIWIRLSRYF